MSNISDKIQANIVEAEANVKRQEAIKNAKANFEKMKREIHISHAVQFLILKISHMVDIGEQPVILTKDLQREFGNLFSFSDNDVKKFELFIENELFKFHNWMEANSLTCLVRGEHDGMGSSSWISMTILPVQKI